MRSIVLTFAVVVMMALPAFAGIPGGQPTGKFLQGAPVTMLPRDWPGDIVKWDQMSGGIDGYAAASWIDTDTPTDALTADDWRCTSPGWVSDIEFAGWSYYGNQYIDKFHVTIYTDVPATTSDASHPGSILWEKDFGLADPNDPHKIGYQDLGDGTFKINVAQPDWFIQQGTPSNPMIYWISIQGLMVQDGYFDAFYWNFKDRYLPVNLDDAAFYSNYFGMAPWWNWGFPAGYADPDLYDGLLPSGWTSADMAFILSPEPATLMLLGLGVLVLRRR